MFDSSDTKPVRASEQLDWEGLARYLCEKLPAVLGENFDTNALLFVEQFPGGHSNLTYLVRYGEAGGMEFVMRRPPFGPVAPRAHDMAREYRLLAAVHPVFPLAPRPYLLCEDLGVIGSTFYLMERRRGLVIRHREPPALADQPPARRLVSEAMVDTLADLHAVDIEAHGLAALGKPAGFVARQVHGWSERWRGSQTRELGEMDALTRWLSEHLPLDRGGYSLVHGDYKLDNVMLDERDISRVVGVFDWEMSAVGDPLVDVGIFLCYWIHTLPASERDDLTTVTSLPGWYTRAEVIERYATRTGRDLTDIRFYEVLALYKLAVILQQIFYRYARGQTDDARFAALDERVIWLARLAAKLIEGD